MPLPPPVQRRTLPLKISSLNTVVDRGADIAVTTGKAGIIGERSLGDDRNDAAVWIRPSAIKVTAEASLATTTSPKRDIPIFCDPSQNVIELALSGLSEVLGGLSCPNSSRIHLRHSQPVIAAMSQPTLCPVSVTRILSLLRCSDTVPFDTPRRDTMPSAALMV